MKIGYFGDGAWSHMALDRILVHPQLEVCFIVARHDGADPELRRRAGELGLPFFTHPDVNAPEFLRNIGRHRPDLLVSMSFNQILKGDILKLAPRGFVNCHAGALPFYRGRNILNWAIINGETQFGVTAHYVDEGIDTGDIIVQRTAGIAHTDTYATVLEKAYILCADVLLDALDAIANDRAMRIPQSSLHPVGTYFTRRRPGDEWLDWEWSSGRINDFVRAITVPGPCARSTMDGTIVAIMATELIPDAPAYLANPGEVVGRDRMGVVVKTGDTTLRVTKIADLLTDGNLSAPRIPKLSIGSRFSSEILSRLQALDQRVAMLEKLQIS